MTQELGPFAAHFNSTKGISKALPLLYVARLLFVACCFVCDLLVASA